MRRDFKAAGKSLLKIDALMGRLLFDRVTAVALTIFVFSLLGTTARAQSNTWTKATDGSWEEPYWSLGIPPASNQTVWINNPGSKTLTINSNTAFNSPQSLAVRSLTISGASNAPNFLVLDHVGLETPLQANDLFVARHSALTLLGSAVQINSSSYEG